MKRLQVEHKKWYRFGLIFLPLVLLLVIDQPKPRSSITVHQDIPLVVVSAPQDAFYELAEEIAAAEAAPIVSELKEGLRLSPQVLLWVISPENLSDQAVVRAGRELLEAGNFPALGLITASTLDDARALWEQRRRAAAGMVVEANALSPAASINEGRIRLMDHNPPTVQSLTIPSLKEVLSKAAYLSFTGHGSGRYWRLDETTTFTAADVPEMPASIISSASCQSFRPWHEESLLLAFADRGAAAYTGFVYSPMDGFLLGEYGGLPFRYTWHEFPVGMVSRVQVEGSLQAYAAVPYYLTLGDARISLNAAPPYSLKQETLTDSAWTIEYKDAPEGVIPVHIKGGEDWHYVDVQGVGNAADGTRFFHARLQAVNLNGDKYLLFVHKGGDFTVSLKRQVPFWWRIVNPMMNAFDETYIAAGMNGGGIILLAVAAPAWVWLLWRRRRKPGFKHALWVGLVPSVLITLWRAGYAWLRMADTAVNCKPLYFEPLWFLGGFALAWAGMVLLHLSTSRGGKTTGLVISLAVGWLSAVFWALAIWMTNIAFMANQVPGVYQAWSSLAELTAAAFELPVFILLFTLSERIFKPGSQK